MALCRASLTRLFPCSGRAAFHQNSLARTSIQGRGVQLVLRRSSSEAGAGQLSSRERLKVMVKEYGSVVMVFHITISLTSLGLFYLAVKTGVDVAGLLSKVGINLQSSAAKGASTFAVAYVAHKALAPARILITLTATPIIVPWLRRAGIMKGPAMAAAAARAANASSKTTPPKS